MQQILSILGSLGFNWHVALANFINFLVILFLLNRYFFGKIGTFLNKRQEIIKTGLQQASDAHKALLVAEENKQNIIKDAEKQGYKILTDAKVEGEEIIRILKGKADEEISKRLLSLGEKEKGLQEDIEKSFLAKAPLLVAKLYTQTLSREMTEKENNTLFNRIIP